MPALARQPRVRSVDPRTYAPFRDFCCGGDSEYEREVDEIVAMLHAGDQPTVVVRVAEVIADDGSHTFLGLCAVARRSLLDVDAAYVALLAVDSRWRGHRLPDGGRLGVLLLGDALDQIKMLWRGPPMPAVWALVAPDNTASHNVFDHWGFGCIPAEGEGYDIRYRPAGLGTSLS